MAGLMHTWRLVGLDLRRDRIKLTVWIVGIIGLMAASIPALQEVYGSSDQAKIGYAASMSSSTIGRAFGGVMNGPTLGDITMVETFTFTAILIAFMAATAVIRHTRHNEEIGAAELLGAGVVGRLAPLTAALIVSIGATLICGTAIALLMLQIEEFSLAGAIGFGAGLASVGLVFAGIAAVAAQLSQSARGAMSITTGAIAGAFLLRAVGDGLATVQPGGLSTVAAWPTWLSPIGWGYQIFPFSTQRWWVFGVFVVAIIAATALAYLLLMRRDVGAGLLADRAGRAQARRSLLSLGGFAWRLQRGVFVGWAVFFVIFGLIFGGMANDFEQLLQSVDSYEAFLGTLQPGQTIIDLFFAMMYMMAGIMAAGYSLQSLLKLRAEESSGRLESLLGAAVKRTSWMLSHIMLTLIGASALLITMGLSAGAAYALTGGDTGEILRIALASFLQLPAVLVFVGIVTAVFGLLPRLVIGVGWAIFILALTISQVGQLLKLPDWVMDLSPFMHAPTDLGSQVEWTPLIVMAVLGSLAVLVGVVSFRRRDVQPG